jgi:hypothetical protein
MAGIYVVLGYVQQNLYQHADIETLPHQGTVD